MKNILKIMLVAMLAITVGVIAYPIVVAATGGSAASVEAAVGYNLYWGYVLFTLSVVSAIFGAIYGMFKASAGLLKTVISVVLVAAIIAGSYLYASSHVIEIVNIENGGVFGAVDTVITESSIMITYITMGAAILAALVSEVIGAFK